jgi:ribosomal protein S30
MAIAILKKRGQMTTKGTLTAAGKKRDSMTAASRAKDRASKLSGKSVKNYTYNPRTNTATLKGKK